MWLLFLVMVFVQSTCRCEIVEKITIATYNIWNIMFNWDVRKFYIAQMIREVNVDIIAFEELRADDYEDLSQLDELQELLPNYRWQHFAVAHKVDRLKESYITGMDLEGIGILSRFPIVRHEVQNLSTSHSSDSNDRVVLHAQVLLDDSFQPDKSPFINIAVVHFSYDRQQQCKNALEVFQFISGRHLRNVIVLGDFNTYKDFESPLTIFTSPHSAASQPGCHSILNSDIKENLFKMTFDDAWKKTNPNKNGFTFSNMPIPGLESRPDRILTMAADFIIRSSGLIGSDDQYKSLYFHHVIWSRLEKVISTSINSYDGMQGRSCPHDCGPHASCRCGICVGGGDQNMCLIPNCNECNVTIFYLLWGFLVISILLASQLLFGILQLLLVMNDQASNRHTDSACCGQVCLCDPALYTSLSARMRRIKKHRFTRIYPLLRLPPMILVIVSLLMTFLLIEFALYAFADLINDVYNIIPEELNPSDHLMLYAELDVKKLHI